jgi:uncharacterized protein (UPF0332 family)
MNIMKKINFLKKLCKEDKLKCIEPSEEIKNSYIEKSESNLISARILLENNRLEESVSLAYYSMYHILTALFFAVGIKCENHTGSIILLKDIFNIDNSEISFAKSERIDKQYYIDFHINKQEVIETIQKSEIFRKTLFDFISKLNTEKINAYKFKFNELLNFLAK